MANRTQRQQTKHDREVEKTAQYYQNQNYRVDADIKGFDTPDTINGRRPDVIAKKGGNTVIVEVETRDSIEKDQGQQETFKNYADKYKNVKFRTKLTK